MSNGSAHCSTTPIPRGTQPTIFVDSDGKGVITRIEGKHRYHVTSEGRAIAVLFTKTYARVLGPGLALLDPKLPEDTSRRSPLATSWRNLNSTLDKFVEDSMTAA